MRHRFQPSASARPAWVSKPLATSLAVTWACSPLLCLMLGMAAPLAHAALPTPSEPAPAAASPVVATVDGEPITLQSVQAMAWRLSQMRPQGPAVTQAQALEQLIDLKLQARQALAQKVDTLPIVAELMAITRMEVLAKGLNDVKRQLQAPPSDAQVKAYFEQHPALFSQRKVYTLQELMIEKSPWTEAVMQKLVATSPNLKALQKSLEEAGGVGKVATSTQAAENLPLDALPDIAAAPEGKPMWRRSPTGALSVYVVAASQLQPRTLEASAPLIRIFLSNKGWIDESARMLAEMRQKAHIERKPLPSPNGDFTFGP